jgi:catechol 2,3-dioxygenase-like lactoylglutathione lyase family enzyme
MRGHHAAVRVPDYETEKRWFIEKLDFRVIHEWPYEDQNLAYVGPANDDHFYIEILGDGEPGPAPKAPYKDLSDSATPASITCAYKWTTSTPRWPSCAAAV